MKCSWVIEARKKDDGESVVPAHECGRTATALYRRRNKKRGPGRRAYEEYPRCSVHDTPAARKYAAPNGFEVLELANEPTS